MIWGLHCKEKLDAGHSSGLKGKNSVGFFYHKVGVATPHGQESDSFR